MDEMDRNKQKLVFTKEMFNTIDKMIEKKNFSLENAILFLKNVGYCCAMKRIYDHAFCESLLNERFKKMIIEEEEKKEGKNESLLVDLCECFSLLNFYFISDELISICVPCLLKAVSKKEESEETQKEVEIALLVLSEMGCSKVKQELYLKEITEIIKHQQKHRNLTKLAYQSAWQFIIDRLLFNYIIDHAVMNEIHFVKEATRELEELTKCVNWKKKEEEMSKEEAKEELTLMRWVETLKIYFRYCSLQNEEYVCLFCRIVQVYRAAKDNHIEISDKCIYSLRNATQNRFMKVEDLLKGGAVDAVLEEMQRRTVDGKIAFESLQFFSNVSYRLKEEERYEMEEAKRKATKMKMLEKLEEEGFEDIVISIHDIFNNRNRQIYTQLIVIVLHLILKA
eukprot:MONOS_8132.1-p1 / transcript=MONOS_8132.1 / gene=MONOS_8132 / organism=Monocercomonoides_exilis_PA203 / gene_product=unspecified product / transcript_product=unspecified product / location=Mono_scaffold00298:6142-7391(-) / protein_length=396 / sequence_SO=supercontig / SO=protein_coding / is_pseudo=false